MLKRLCLGLAGAVGLFLAGYWFTTDPAVDAPTIPPSVQNATVLDHVRNSTQALRASAKDTTTNSTGPEKKTDTDEQQDNTLDLALKSIDLSQGEGGFEIWRLKAEWANMQKENSQITVDKPKLIYFMKDDNKELHVTSDTGNIDQKEQVLKFIKQVIVSQEDKTIRGELLIYNGTAKTMTFPQGGRFTGTGVAGNGTKITWHMGNRTIEATDGVSVFFDRIQSEK